MRSRPLIASICALLAIATGGASTAMAQQTSPNAAQQALIDALAAAAAANGTPIPGLDAPEGEDAPIPDSVSPTTVVPENAAPAPALTTPVPPSFLVPGQSAAVQPIAGVERLTDPQVPLEPIRLAALIAALLAVLAVGAAALLRGLGLRTAATSPLQVGTRRRGPFSRVRDRSGTLADDVRDFLRHSR